MWKLLLNFIPGIGPFVSAAGTFIADHWKIIAVAVMIGMLAYQNFSSTRYLLWIPTIPHLQQELAQEQLLNKKLSASLDIAVKSNTMLATRINDNNATVQQWKDVSDKLQKQNDALVGTLALMQANTHKQVMAILAGKTPQTCEASIQYLRDIRPQLTW